MSPDDPLRLAKARTTALLNTIKQLELRARGGVAPQRHQILEARATCDKICQHLGDVHVQRTFPAMLTAAELATQNDGST